MAITLPEAVMRPLFTRLFRWGLVPYPPGAIDYLKYPVTVSGERFERATDFRCRFGLEEIFASVRRIAEAARAARGHILNLGHGCLPDTPVEGVRAFTDAARALGEEAPRGE